MSFQTATLTGTYQLPDGTPASGWVTIIPNSKAVIDLAGNVIRTGRTKVELDDNGHFTATVIATDDASLEPSTGRQYTIDVTLKQSKTAVPLLQGITLLHGQTYDTADLTTGVEASAVYSAFFNPEDYAGLLDADAANASAISAEASARSDADALLAPKASPALTGTPTAPTATPGTNTTQIATTAFIKAAVDALVAGAPGALDTLNEIAVQLGSDETAAGNLTTLVTAIRGLTDSTHMASLTAAFAARWQATHAYLAGDLVLAPDGKIIQRNADGTSRASYDATEQALWTVVAGGGGGAVSSVAGRTGAVTLAKGDVGLGSVDNTTDSAKPVSTAQQTALNAKADLVGGVIPTAQLPALAINDTFPVASQAAMLALTAQRGDVAIRSDLGKSFILSVDAPTVLANWLELSATGKVTSVAGQQGVVVLAKTDVGLGNVDNTSDANKPVSTAQAAAITASTRPAWPTYIPSTATGRYDPSTSFYNVKPSNTRRLRKALGTAGRSDNGNAAGVYNELWVGDSIASGCTGLGLGVGGTDRFDRLNTVAQFHAKALAARTGIPVAGTGLMRFHDGGRFDARFTLSASVTSANSSAGSSLFLPQNGTVDYTTVAPSDTVRVSYYDNFTGTGGFKVAVNGATSGTGFATPTGVGDSKWKTVTLTHPTRNGWAAGSDVTITGVTNSGGMVIGFLEVTTTAGGIATHQHGASGSGAYDWADVAGGGGFNLLRTSYESPKMIPYDYSVVHIAFGLFDAQNSTVSAFKTNMQVIHDYFPNSDIMLHAMPVPGQYAATPQTWLDFVTAYFQLADLWDCPLVDVQNLFGGYSAMSALGLTADTTAHYLQPAYQMWAQATARLAA